MSNTNNGVTNGINNDLNGAGFGWPEIADSIQENGDIEVAAEASATDADAPVEASASSMGVTGRDVAIAATSAAVAGVAATLVTRAVMRGSIPSQLAGEMAAMASAKVGEHTLAQLVDVPAILRGEAVRLLEPALALEESSKLPWKNTRASVRAAGEKIKRTRDARLKAIELDREKRVELDRAQLIAEGREAEATPARVDLLDLAHSLGGAIEVIAAIQAASKAEVEAVAAMAPVFVGTWLTEPGFRDLFGHILAAQVKGFGPQLSAHLGALNAALNEGKGKEALEASKLAIEGVIKGVENPQAARLEAMLEEELEKNKTLIDRVCQLQAELAAATLAAEADTQSASKPGNKSGKQ